MSINRIRATSARAALDDGRDSRAMLSFRCAALFMVTAAVWLTGVIPAHAATLSPFRSLYAFPDNPAAMSGPAAVVVAPDGDVMYADAGTTGDNSGGGYHRIRVISPTGVLKASWGSKGSGQGKFRAPQALAVGPDNRVYVADTYNNRVQVFNRDGTFVRAWGTVGSGNGQLKEPRGIAVDKDGKVYVADSGNSRVQVFSATGGFLESWGSVVTAQIPTTFDTPVGIAVDANLRVYVTDLNKFSVKQFSAGPVRTLLTTWGWTTGGSPNTSRYSFPRAITLSPDGTNLIIADTGNCRIERCSLAGASLETTGGIPASSAVGRFDQPRGAAMAADGTLVVADTRNGRIQRSCVATGWATPWRMPWSTPSSIPGLLSAPEAVASDPTSGAIYVADSANSRVLRYAADGSYVGVFAPAGSGIGQVTNPKGLLVLDDGTVVVADTGNNRIQVFTAEGAYIRSIGVGVLNGPRAMVKSEIGAFFVADTGNSRVARFDWLTGTYVAQVGTPGSGAGQLNAPQGVALFGTNVLWIADTGNNRVQKYNVGGVVASPQSLSGLVGGPANDGLSRPSAVLVEGSDVVVADSNKNRLLRCDSQANWLEEFEGVDANAGALDAPVAIASAPGGRTLVLERDGCQVQVLVRDDAPPTTTTLGVPTERVQSATISLVATDSPAGVISTYLRLDGGATQTVSAPVTVSTEGTHTIDYWSVDRVGNIEPAHRETFAIDLTPPSGSFSFANGSTVTSDTVVSVESAVIGAVEMRVGVAFQTGEWGAYAETTQAILPSLDDTYTVRVDYRDIAGNILPTTREIMLDRTGPAIVGLLSSTHPTADPVWGPISASWGVGTDVTGIAGYSAVVDTNPAGIAPLVVSSTVTSATFVSPVTEGTWYMHVRAVDGVGNWGPIYTISGETLADTEAPATTSSGVPAVTVNSTVTISLEATDAISGVAGVRYRFAPNTTWVPFEAPIQVTDEGTHTLQYQAYDRAGQLEVMQERTFTIDLTGPTVTGLRFTPGVASVLASWGNAPDVAGVAGFAVSVDQSATGDPGFVLQTDPSVEFQPVGTGWYVHVRALDIAGNWGAVTERRYDRIQTSLSRPAAVRRIRTHRQVVLAVSGLVAGDASGSESSIVPTGSVSIVVERYAQGTWSQVCQSTAQLEPTGSLDDMTATYVGRAAFWPLSPRSGVQEVLRVRVFYNGNRDYLAAISQRARVSTLR